MSNCSKSFDILIASSTVHRASLPTSRKIFIEGPIDSRIIFTASRSVFGCWPNELVGVSPQSNLNARKPFSMHAFACTTLFSGLSRSNIMVAHAEYAVLCLSAKKLVGRNAQDFSSKNLAMQFRWRSLQTRRPHRLTSTCILIRRTLFLKCSGVSALDNWTKPFFNYNLCRK